MVALLLECVGLPCVHVKATASRSVHARSVGGPAQDVGWWAARRTAGRRVDEPPAGVSTRTAVRAAIEIERRWRAPGSWTQSALPQHRCRANEKIGEVLGADLLSDGRRVVVSGRMPALLQVWSLARSSSHMLTHCLRGRTYVNGLEPGSHAPNTPLSSALLTHR